MAKAKTADGEDGEAKSPKPAKTFSTRTIAIGIAALVALGGGAGAALLLRAPAGGGAPTPPPVKPAIFVDVPEVLVNLAGGSADRTQYLRIKIVLEVPDQALAGQLAPLMPRVTDAFQTYLRELRASDLEGSPGLYRLREELTRRVNAVVAPSRVTAVLFKEIIIQ
jgi:flagellar FliL protein